MKNFNFKKLGVYIVPIGLGVAAFISAVLDQKKDKKIDTLIEKVEILTEETLDEKEDKE